MRIFRDLEIYGDAAARSELFDSLRKTKFESFLRNTKREEDLDDLKSSEVDLLCFDVTDNKMPSASIFLMNDRDKVFVSNVVPHDVGHLEFDEYNSIVKRFHEEAIAPLSKESLNIEITDGEYDVEAEIPKSLTEKLKAFSRCANRSTGSSHPLDRARWFAVISESHRLERPLESYILFRWLKDDEGWPEDTASNLCSEYEFGLDLLEYYDSDA
jgi:hypothetical protein